MIRQCAWCCSMLGEIAPLDDLAVTHGMCPECYAACLEGQGETASCDASVSSDSRSIKISAAATGGPR